MRRVEFWSHVDKTETCWLWTGARNERGYGRLNKNYAHRVSWEMHNGPIPDGRFIMHACDNPPCVNPEHLSIGTQSDNMRDCATKGRVPAKLTAAAVREIRAAHRRGESAEYLAEKYSVTKSAVHAVVSRQNWKHVAEVA